MLTFLHRKVNHETVSSVQRFHSTSKGPNHNDVHPLLYAPQTSGSRTGCFQTGSRVESGSTGRELSGDPPSRGEVWLAGRICSDKELALNSDHLRAEKNAHYPQGGLRTPFQILKTNPPSLKAPGRYPLGNWMMVNYTPLTARRQRVRNLKCSVRNLPSCHSRTRKLDCWFPVHFLPLATSQYVIYWSSSSTTRAMISKAKYTGRQVQEKREVSWAFSGVKWGYATMQGVLST